MTFDVLVIGAGHAGCEAALAAARMDCKTALVTLNFDRIGHLPCNCSIGGPAKGHLAREVDALGGEMGQVTDQTLTHIRFVGTGKGPAVQTLRAHADKDLYPRAMRAVIESTPNLTLLQASVEDLIVEGSGVQGRGSDKTGQSAVDPTLGRPISGDRWESGVGSMGSGASPTYPLTHSPTHAVQGVRLTDGTEIKARTVVITTGTFLNGLMHCGESQTHGGRHGEARSVGLSAALQRLGMRMGRFKTGTTPRVDRHTIDFEATLAVQSEDCPPFSFQNDTLNPSRPLLHPSAALPRTP